MKTINFIVLCILIVLLNSCKPEVSQNKGKYEKVEEMQNSEKLIVEENNTSSKLDSELGIIKNTEKKDKKVKERVFEANSQEIVENNSVGDIDKTELNIPEKPSKLKPTQKKLQKGTLSFISKTYDFGFIDMGDVVDHSFKFINTGKKAINISNVTASCGCTTPVFPFLPIEPGESGKIDVRFNSKGRLGPQSANITVYSDSEEGEMDLEIKGTVRTEIASPSEFIDTTNQ